MEEFERRLDYNMACDSPVGGGATAHEGTPDHSLGPMVDVLCHLALPSTSR